MSIPTRAEELSAEWLTTVLSAGGHLADARVTSVRSEAAGQDQGFASQLLRVSLEYDRPGAGPASLIAKLPPALEFVRELMAGFGFDRREVSFYGQLAPDCGVTVPRCYWAELHPELGHGGLLLEDLHDAEVRDQVESCPPALAEQIVRNIAGFHARFWNDATTRRLDWLTGNMGERYLAVGALYAERSQTFMRACRDWLPSRFREAMPQIARLIGSHLEHRDLSVNSTLLHGDFRLENMLLTGSPDGETQITVIDFQLLGWGSVAYDLAYFIGQSLKTKPRRDHQEALLGAYHEVLCAAGVEGYGAQLLQDEFQLFLLYATSIPVLLSDTVANTETLAQQQGEQGKAARDQLPALKRLFSAMSRRCVDAVLDNDALSRLR